MPIRAEHGFELFDEVVHVFELAVNRGKTHERDLVDRAEPIEDFLADIAGGNFAVEALIDVGLDVANDGLDLAFADWPLVAGLFQTGPDLLPVEGNAGAVFLDHFEGRFLDLFVSRESPLANQALAPPPDHEILAGARINDFRLPVATERANHVKPKPRSKAALEFGQRRPIPTADEPSRRLMPLADGSILPEIAT